MADNYDWMSGFQPQQTNPWLSALGMGLPMLGSAIGALFPSEAQKFQKWQHGQAKSLFTSLGQPRGPAISQGMINYLSSLGNRANQPMMGNMLYGASRNAGLSSPQTWRMAMQQWMPIQAGMTRDLNLQNIQMTQQMRQFLDSLRASLVRG